MKKALLILLLLPSCASFRTVQIDERKNEKTGEITKITTRAGSISFFDGKSNLTKWKATQSEKSQGAEVGGLSQSVSSSNLVTISGNALELGRLLKP